MKTTWMRGLLLALTVSLAACQDDVTERVAAPGPTPGVLAVVLHSPFDDDGAVSFEIRGADITDVRASGAEAFVTSTGGGMRIALVGHAVGGELIRFHVPDIRELPVYEAALVAVADTRNLVRAATDGYRLEVVAVD